MPRKKKKPVLKKGGKLEKRYLSGLSKKAKAKKKREIAKVGRLNLLMLQLMAILLQI